VRLAEDAATLSILSGGRFDLGVAAGYRELEFEAFGRKLAHRPSLLEESIEICRRAWTGEPVDFRGRRFRVPALPIEPAPANPPRILIGAHVDAALERAARLGDGFLAPYRSHFDRCLAATERVGKDPADAKITICDFALIGEDPEATWASVGRHALYQINEYIKWDAAGIAGEEPPPLIEDPQGLLDAGTYRLLDREAAIEDLTSMLERWPQIEDVSFWAQLPGESVDSGSRRMEFLASKVLPEVRERLGVAVPSAAR
jgi:alkanesulfonate monooxygenase SsuD/methylene tetrahydromethanopterin reductase-like flavin-dependent oxidoreductase (luciferase family)